MSQPTKSNAQRSSTPRLLAVAVGVGLVYAVGSLLLQRYVAQTRSSAGALVALWTVIVGVGAVALARRDRSLRLPAVGTWALATLATLAIGYWTGFRDTQVDEDIVVAGAQAQGAERNAALAGSGSGSAQARGSESKSTTSQSGSRDDAAASARTTASAAAEPKTGASTRAQPAAASKAKTDDTAENKPAAAPTPKADDAASAKPAGPVSLAAGSFVGVDGHDGTGTAEVVKTASGERRLTFSGGFDVDPGPDINVYLSETAGGVSGAKRIGSLKGNKGAQQYTIPADVDLSRFSNVVLYCEPFSIRVAVAELDV